jgi:hypothetical protein
MVCKILPSNGKLNTELAWLLSYYFTFKKYMSNISNSYYHTEREECRLNGVSVASTSQVRAFAMLLLLIDGIEKYIAGVLVTHRLLSVSSL